MHTDTNNYEKFISYLEANKLNYWAKGDNFINRITVLFESKFIKITWGAFFDSIKSGSEVTEHKNVPLFYEYRNIEKSLIKAFKASEFYTA